MEQIAYPFRIGVHGGVVTSADGSDQEAFECIQQIIETRPGELLFAEEFGVPDPVFNELDPGDIQATLNMFGPEDISIDALATHFVDETTTRLTFEWSRDIDNVEEAEDE